jgi:hypothetical protein
MEKTETLEYSSGLDARYGAHLSRYIAELAVGESIFWTPDGWSRAGPGMEFVKEAHGFIRPKRK